GAGWRATCTRRGHGSVRPAWDAGGRPTRRRAASRARPGDRARGSRGGCAWVAGAPRPPGGPGERRSAPRGRALPHLGERSGRRDQAGDNVGKWYPVPAPARGLQLQRAPQLLAVDLAHRRERYRIVEPNLLRALRLPDALDQEFEELVLGDLRPRLAYHERHRL